MSSVCQTVTLVDQDHIGWKSWKLLHGHLAQHLHSSESEPKGQPVTPRGTRGNFGETRGGVGKNGVLIWSTKAAISLKRVKIQIKLLWEAYIGTHHIALSNGTTPNCLRPPLPQDWGSHPWPRPKLQSLLSQEREKLLISNLASTFRGSIRIKAHEKFCRIGSVGVSRDCQNFLGTPYYLWNG